MQCAMKRKAADSNAAAGERKTRASVPHQVGEASEGDEEAASMPSPAAEPAVMPAASQLVPTTAPDWQPAAEAAAERDAGLEAELEHAVLDILSRRKPGATC